MNQLYFAALATVPVVLALLALVVLFAALIFGPRADRKARAELRAMKEREAGRLA